MVEGHITKMRPVSDSDLGALNRLAGDRKLSIRAEGQGLLKRFYVIETKKGDVIGYIGLEGVTWCSGELRVCILDSQFLGRGYGTDAVSTFTGFVFSSSSLRYIYLRVIRQNAMALRCYRKCGFYPEAVLKSRRQYGYSDVVLMRRDRL